MLQRSTGRECGHVMARQSTKYRLEHIDIEVNHRCNLACRHCSARAAKKRQVNELDIRQILEILQDAIPLGLKKVGLTGGEPLYDVLKLKAVAEHCLKELSVPIHMHTNGTLVKEEHCRDGGVLTVFESVSVTFLGGDTKTHEAMTKTPGSFDGSLKGAKVCAEFNLPLTCYFIPTSGTCPGFKELAESLHAIGVKRIRAMALAPSGRARAIYGETAPPRDELTEFEEDLLDVRDRLGIHVEAGYCTRLSMPRLEVLSGHDKCMSGINRLHINSKGDVFPCTAAGGVKELKLGNLVKNGTAIESIWRHSQLVKLIRQMHCGELPACGECARRPQCRSGCTVNACGTMSDAERQSCPLFSHNGR